MSKKNKKNKKNRPAEGARDGKKDKKNDKLPLGRGRAFGGKQVLPLPGVGVAVAVPGPGGLTLGSSAEKRKRDGCKTAHIVWYLVPKGSKIKPPDRDRDTKLPPGHAESPKDFNISHTAKGKKRHVIEVNAKYKSGFDPQFSIIKAGTEVEFKNTDDIIHTLFCYTMGNQFYCTGFFEGTSIFVTFEHISVGFGACNIFSATIEKMHCKLLILPTDIWVESRGRHEEVKFKDVPPGKYILKCWSRREGCCGKSKEVTIEPGSDGRVLID